MDHSLGTVTAGPPQRTAVGDRRLPAGLVWLGGTAAFGIAASVLYHTTGLGVPCFFRAATGWDCPFCGGTRMGGALLELDIPAAFWFNPLAFIGLVAATLVGGWLVIETATGHRGALMSRVRSVLGRIPVRVTPTGLAIAAAVVLVAWTVLRNLLLGPLP